MAMPTAEWSVTEATWAELAALPVTPRLGALLADFRRRLAASPQRRLVGPELVQARDAALLTAYRQTVGQPAIRRRARALTVCAETLPLTVTPDELLVGSQMMNGGVGADPAVRAELSALGYATTTGHIVHDYAKLLRLGVAGCLAEVEEALAAGGEAVMLAACREALLAFQAWIRRHAAAVAALPGGAGRELSADLRRLAGEPPRTFAEALQLVWFAQIFLHLENPSAAISFGRMDQYLWPLLDADLAAGRMNLPAALEWVGAFCLKACEGEESQNAVVGGVDADGRDAANLVSLLFLAALQQLRVFQPSLTVRWHPAANAAFVHAACDLAAAGTGNPGFMNDAPVIAALHRLGVPLRQARDWAVVGCYEATLPGIAYPNTVLGRLHLVEALADYLATPAAQQAPDYAAFQAGCLAAVSAAYARLLGECQQRWNTMRDLAPSPFGSVLMQGCVERGQPLEAGAARYNFVGINILGLGTLVDSLRAVRELVFTRGELTLAALAEQVAADFPDERLRQRLLHLPGRYGTDHPETNALAAELSTAIARMVLASRLDAGPAADLRPYPGFFAFSADIYACQRASPDGRRQGEVISYGAGPASHIASSPTAVLRSAAHVAHDQCACGNPVAISLSRQDVDEVRGGERLRALLTGYFVQGGMHVHFNLMDAAALREAQARPQEFADLTVRVSGYSARFAQVERRWQDALITRAEHGL